MQDFLYWLNYNFNNRELAGAIWLFLIFIVLFFHVKTRNALERLLSTLFALQLVTVCLNFATYLVYFTWLGEIVGIWKMSQLTPTIFWYLIGGIPLLMRSFNDDTGVRHFKGYAKDVISGTAILEFVYVAKTFSLPVELLLTPIVVIISMLAVFSEGKREHADTNKILNFILTVIILGVLWNSVSQVLGKPEDFFTKDTFFNFILPIQLTIGSIPFFYFMYCYAQREQIKVQLGFKTFQSEGLKLYAKSRFSRSFFLKPWLFRRALRQFHNMPAIERQDVDKIIQQIRYFERQSKFSPVVEFTKGWSPYKAREFLSNEGLRAGDYHPSFDGDEWWSGVASKELDGSLISNIVNYSFSGVFGSVSSIKLRGNFKDSSLTVGQLNEFKALSTVLILASIECDLGSLSAKIDSLEDFEILHGGRMVRLRRERFPNNIGFNLTLEIARK